MKILCAAALTIILGMSASPVRAETPLSESKIEATIDAMRDLRPVMEEHQDELEKLVPEEQRATLDPCAPPDAVKKSAAFGEMEGIVRKHGFESGEQWCRMAQRVTAAYAAVKLDAEEPQWREKMAEVRQQIESASELSAEQKAQLLAQLEQTTAMIGAQDAPEADKAAVKANLPEIDRAIQEAYPPAE